MADEDRLQRIEEKLTSIDTKLTDLRIAVEHRLTKVEGRASIFSIIGVALAALIAWWLK